MFLLQEKKSGKMYFLVNIHMDDNKGVNCVEFYKWLKDERFALKMMTLMLQ